MWSERVERRRRRETRVDDRVTVAVGRVDDDRDRSTKAASRRRVAVLHQNEASIGDVVGRNRSVAAGR